MPLQRIQIVKGWLDGGELHEQVIDIAGDANNGASVDATTCTPEGTGSDSLCGHFEDANYDPAQPAFYYARAVENPSCRWIQHACNDAGVRCNDAATITPGFEPCCDAGNLMVQQERAWSSPIWTAPAQP